jgi:hypothetical protein
MSVSKFLDFPEIPSSLHGKQYRPDIDGLRAVAVSSVVICHALPTVLPGGFVGVAIFFVISGYLISSILISDLESERFSILKFYDRRIRRIFPALITILVFTSAVGWLILYRPEFKLLGGLVLVCGALVMAGTPPSRLYRFDLPARTEWDFLKERTSGFNDNGNGIYPLHSERLQQALFIGDSHVAQYAERIDKIVGADPSRLGAVLALGGGCIPIENVSTTDIGRNGCWSLRYQAYQMALDGRFKTIVIGGAWNWYFFEKTYSYNRNGQSFPLTSDSGRTAAIEQLQLQISELVKGGKRVVFLLDNPASSAFIPANWGLRLVSSSAQFTPNKTLDAPTNQLELQRQLAAMAYRAGAVVVDPFGAICTGEKCRVTSETGQPLFKDFGHFNPDWAVNHADFVDVTTAR